jgi:hypothetical protein
MGRQNRSTAFVRGLDGSPVLWGNLTWAMGINPTQAERESPVVTIHVPRCSDGTTAYSRYSRTNRYGIHVGSRPRLLTNV